jgi:hypothetical protein
MRDLASVASRTCSVYVIAALVQQTGETKVTENRYMGGRCGTGPWGVATGWRRAFVNNSFSRNKFPDLGFNSSGRQPAD